jgi:hypothetical protein
VTLTPLRAASPRGRGYVAPAAFIEHATPPNFLDRLKTDIQNFQQAIDEKAKGKKTHVDATAGMKAALKQGLAAVKRLDAIVRNTLAGDTEAIGAWERAIQVEHVGRRSNGKPATTGQPATSGQPATAGHAAPAAPNPAAAVNPVVAANPPASASPSAQATAQ